MWAGQYLQFSNNNDMQHNEQRSCKVQSFNQYLQLNIQMLQKEIHQQEKLPEPAPAKEPEVI